MLHEPVLLVMLTGWIDAAGAAAAAADAFSKECETSPILRFDDDTFIDFRARRPVMALRDGVNTDLAWSSIELRAGRSSSGRDVLVLVGPEPDMAWHRFARLVSDISVELGVTRMIALGAYPFAAPHTRTPRLSCSSPSTDVLANVTFARSSVDVPAGIAAVLEHALHARKIPTLGIWAQVPHYVVAMPYPAASVALLDGVTEVTGIEVAASSCGPRSGRSAKASTPASTAIPSTSRCCDNSRSSTTPRSMARSRRARRWNCAPATNSPTRSKPSSATRTDACRFGPGCPSGSGPERPAVPAVGFGVGSGKTGGPSGSGPERPAVLWGRVGQAALSMVRP
jgi:hypothetical protein